jgi:hypothetical protein
MRWPRRGTRPGGGETIEPPGMPDELEVLDGDDDAIVGRPERWPRPTTRELRYAASGHDPSGSAGLWRAIEHL